MNLFDSSSCFSSLVSDRLAAVSPVCITEVFNIGSVSRRPVGTWLCLWAWCWLWVYTQITWCGFLHWFPQIRVYINSIRTEESHVYDRLALLFISANSILDPWVFIIFSPGMLHFFGCSFKGRLGSVRGSMCRSSFTRENNFTHLELSRPAMGDRVYPEKNTWLHSVAFSPLIFIGSFRPMRTFIFRCLMGRSVPPVLIFWVCSFHLDCLTYKLLWSSISFLEISISIKCFFNCCYWMNTVFLFFAM